VSKSECEREIERARERDRDEGKSGESPTVGPKPCR
jgi:hypothetical protein